MTLSLLSSRLQNYPTFAAFASLLVGTFVLIGWAVERSLLRSVVPGLFVMEPTTALGLILLGTAMWCLSKKMRVAQRTAAGCAFAVLAIGLFTTLEYVIGWNPGFDQWLFHEPLDLTRLWSPSRIGLNSALCFVLFGAALLLRIRTSAHWSYVYEGATLGGLLLAYLALLGYLYHIPFLYGIGRFAPMAIPTAITLMVLGIGILCLQPRRGIMAIITSQGAGGKMLKRLLPAGLLLLPAIGWLRLIGERQGLYATELGLALFVTLTTVTLFLLLIWTARSLNSEQQGRDESEQRFRQLAESIREVFWLSNPAKNQVLYISPGYETIWGRSCDSLYVSPTSWAETIHPEDRDRIWQAVTTKQSAGTYDEEYRILRPDGSIRWIHDRAFPVQNEEGHISRIAGIAEDITERKLAEDALHEAHDELETRVLHRTSELTETNAALRESEGRFRAIFEQAAVGVAQIDTRTGRFVRVNQRYADILGMTKEEITAMDFMTIMHPDDLQPDLAKMDDLMAGRIHTFSMEKQLYHKDRSLVWINLAVSPMWASGQDPTFHIAVVEDVTKRKRAEEALKESEERCSSLISQATDVIYTAGLDGRFTFVNAAACAITGYQEEELLGKHYLELIRPDFREAAQRLYKQQLLERTPSTYFEFSAITKDGRETCFGQRVQLRFVDGKIVGVEAIARDITERKQAEEALAERARLAGLAAEVSLALNADLSIDERLHHCTESIVRHLGAALVRIWTVEPGDLCEDCFKKDWCTDRTQCLHLSASAGLSTNLNGEYRRVPLGALKIGKIAQGMGIMSSNDILNDEWLPNKEWMREHGLHSFAGFPLTIEGQVYGVLALFAKVPLSEPTLKTLESTCNGVAAAIARQQAEEALRSAYTQLRDLAHRLETAKEAERQKIARELHDEFGQALTGMKLDLAWLRSRAARLTPLQAGKALVNKTEAISASVDALIDAVRETATSLRPSMLDDLGLIPALEWLTNQFRTKANVDCKLEIAPEIERVQMTADSSTALFRMTQEMLTNVIRHANASTVHLRLFETTGCLVLECTDNGDGITVHRIRRPASLGLRGLEERAALLGGSFTITGMPGIGTTARVSLPLTSVIIPTMENQP